MATRFKFEEPEKINATLTITMTVQEWLQVRDVLCNGRACAAWPMSIVEHAITDCVAKAKTILWPDEMPKS